MKDKVRNKLLSFFHRPVVSTVNDENFNVKSIYEDRTSKFCKMSEVFNELFVKCKYSVFWTLFRFCWLNWISMVLQRFFITGLNVIYPYLLIRVYSILNDRNRNSYDLSKYLMLIMFKNFVDIFIWERWWNLMRKYTEEIKYCFAYALYKKSLRTYDCETSKEKLINLSQNDLWRFGGLLWRTFEVPDKIIRIIASYIYLFAILGYSAAASIFVMLFVLFPIIYYGMKYARDQEKEINETSDKRIKVLTEVIRTIRFIKSYVWEDIYEKKIQELRERETTARKKNAYGWAFVGAAWAASNFFMSTTSWLYYLYIGRKFDAAVCFTVISLTSGTANQVFSLVSLFNEIVKVKLSSKRVLEYMEMEEQSNYFRAKKSEKKMEFSQPIEEDSESVEDLYDFEDDSSISQEEKEIIRIIQEEDISDILETPIESTVDKNNDEKEIIILDFKNCSFSWKETKEDEKKEKDENIIIPRKREELVLKNISLKIKEGEFIGVSGKIGSGKTALVNSILSEMKCISSERKFIKPGIISVYSQNHWIRSGTIRDNVLFGSPYIKERYEDVIRCCCLEAEISEFSDGDSTLIGENGVTLSGGQKARVCLARFAYSISLNNENKIILYVADDPFKDLDESTNRQIMNNLFLGEILKNKTKILITHHLESLKFVDRLILMENGKILKIGNPSILLKDHLKSPTPIKTPISNFNDVISDSLAKKVPKRGEILEIYRDEERIAIHDKVEFKLLWTYVTESKFISLLILFFIFLKFLFENFHDLALGEWSSDTNLEKHSLKYYIIRDFIIGIGVMILVILIRTVFKYYSFRVSTIYHGKMLHSLFSAPCKWFDLTKSGSIISRFSGDLRTLDGEVGYRIKDFFCCICSVIGTFAFILYCVPIYVVVLIPLIGIVYYMLRKSIRTYIKIVKLDAKFKEPMISLMNETNHGLMIIRAFKREKMFFKEMKEKLCDKLRMLYLHTDMCFVMTTRSRFCMNFSFFCFCLLVLVFGIDGVSASMGLRRLLDADWLVAWVMYLIPGIQKCLVSLERIYEYGTTLPEEEKQRKKNIEKEKEKNEDDEDSELKRGEIEFKNVEFKYYEDEDEENILNKISFQVKAGSTLGIVGRTGSGKSTIVKTLFGLYEEQIGDIYVHGRKKTDWESLKELRASIIYIAQNPTLLDGNLRQNLDLTGEIEDHQIWDALNTVDLASTLKERLGLSLDSSLEGIKLSAGEKQLLCFGRALLKKNTSENPILVLDEATSACDLETDKKIQEIVKTCFHDCTIIAIAHRIETIIQFDRIIAIKGGKIVQNGPPKMLLENEAGLFFNMCKKTGRKRLEKLRKLACG